MTFIWLIAWLISHTPQVQVFGVWNNWGIALAVCLAIDLIGSMGANAWRQSASPGSSPRRTDVVRRVRGDLR